MGTARLTIFRTMLPLEKSFWIPSIFIPLFPKLRKIHSSSIIHLSLSSVQVKQLLKR